MKEFKVAIVGQIARWKGQDVFIKAAKLLHNKYPEMKFYIIGDVIFEKKEDLQYKNLLLDLAKNCDYIKFLGHLNNILGILKDIDVLVHASIREEPFGRVIIEGMASKKPVIASGIGGPLELIEDGKSGILYEAGNFQELARKIDLLANDNQAYELIANGGFTRFLGEFHLQKTISLVEEYIEILSIK